MPKINKQKLVNGARVGLVVALSVVSVTVFVVNLLSQQYSSNKILKAVSKFVPSVKMGLDLKGGSQMVLSINFNKLMEDKYSSVSNGIRELMWEERVAYGSIQETPTGIVILGSSISKLDLEKLQKVVHKNHPGMTISKTNNGAIVSFSEAEMSSIHSMVMEKVVKTVRNRIDESGTKEIIIQRMGNSNILVQIPGIENPEGLKRLLGRMANLTFHLVSEESPITKEYPQIVPPDCNVLQGYNNNLWYKVKKYVSLNGNELSDARVVTENMKINILFRLNSTGARKFAEITSENTGKLLAIVLDGKVLTAPVINSPIIGGSGVINGSFTVGEATEIAGLLRSGSLPAPIEVIEEKTIGPSVGVRSIKSAGIASIVAIAGITIFMVARYGSLGVVASVAIILNLTTAVTVIAVFGISLTLPGIAALLLTLGMSVDANVLIYERMRDEIKSGETRQGRIVTNGFKGSWTGIFDSNLTTFLAAVTMIAFGSGFIRGFAISLIIGIACSLFSAITFAKMVINWLFVSKGFKIKLKAQQ